MLTSTTAPKTLSPAQQNAVNVKLLDAILYHKHDDFDAALAEGADIEAMGVDWDERDQPTHETPLATAVGCTNVYAVEQLIARGAEPDTCLRHGSSAIYTAVTQGNPQVLRLILDKRPQLPKKQVSADDTLTQVNLLHSSLISFPSYALIELGKWKDDATRDLLRHFYADNEVTIPDNLEVDFTGNIPVMKLLLDIHPELLVKPAIIKKTGEQFTVLDVVNNPQRYKHLFTDGTDALELAIYMNGMANNDVIKFKISLTNCLNSDPIPVTVNFDFRFLRAAFDAKAKEALPVYQQVKRVETRVDSLELQIEEIAATLGPVLGRMAAAERAISGLSMELERQHPYYKEISALEAIPVKERYFDVVSRQLYVMLSGYVMMSSDLSERNKSTIGDCGVSVARFLGEAVPSPWGTLFKVGALVGEIAVEKVERNRFERITSLLPVDRLQGYAQELGYLLTTQVFQRFEAAGGAVNTLEDAAQLDAKKRFAPVLDLAKTTFKLAIESVYSVSKPDIDGSLSATGRANALTDRILDTVTASAKLQKKVLEKASQNAGTLTLAYDSKRNGTSAPDADELAQALEVTDEVAKAAKKSKKCVIM